MNITQHIPWWVQVFSFLYSQKMGNTVKCCLINWEITEVVKRSHVSSSRVSVFSIMYEPMATGKCLNRICVIYSLIFMASMNFTHNCVVALHDATMVTLAASWRIGLLDSLSIPENSTYRLTSSIRAPNPKSICFSSRLAVVFANPIQS